MNLAIKVFQILNFSFKFLFGNQVNEKKLLKKYLQNKKITYLDIGANVGNDIEFIKKIFNKNKLDIHAFEPIGDLAKKLEEKHTDITVNNLAISNEQNVKMFYESKISSQSSLNKNLDNPLKIPTKEYLVNTNTLENYILEKNITHIDLIKIDTEGHDYEVLQSLGNFYDYVKINLIKLEFLFNNQNFKDNMNFNKIIQLLYKYNFEILAIPNLKHINNELFLADVYFKNTK